jgi:3-hydroxyisobutyrate dehydrogenase-like beta-hydroxyacid dehydrogenase
MKLTAVAAMIMAGAFAGSALAQATMQPIPNPPEKPKAMAKHHGKAKHHAKAKAEKAAAPAPAAK